LEKVWKFRGLLFPPDSFFHIITAEKELSLSDLGYSPLRKEY